MLRCAFEKSSFFDVEAVCTNCDGGCEDGCCEQCAQPKRFVWFDWCPTRAHLAQKKLYRKTVVKKVPRYKRVVVDCCGDCCAKNGSHTKPAPKTADVADES